jgi:hypothetical protein
VPKFPAQFLGTEARSLPQRQPPRLRAKINEHSQSIDLCGFFAAAASFSAPACAVPLIAA